MAEVRKQSRIPFNNLPEINSNTGGYYVRYRIISEDRNRASHWGPIQLIDPNLELVPSGSLVVEQGTGSVSLIWNPVNLKINNDFEVPASAYDIWIRWNSDDNGDWTYIERTSGTSSRVIIPNDYAIDGALQGIAPTKADFEIYVNGRPIQRGDGQPQAVDTLLLKAYQTLDFTL